MKDYLIWICEKLEAATGVTDWELLMALCMHKNYIMNVPGLRPENYMGLNENVTYSIEHEEEKHRIRLDYSCGNSRRGWIAAPDTYHMPNRETDRRDDFYEV